MMLAIGPTPVGAIQIPPHNLQAGTRVRVPSSGRSGIARVRSASGRSGFGLVQWELDATITEHRWADMQPVQTAPQRAGYEIVLGEPARRTLADIAAERRAAGAAPGFDCPPIPLNLRSVITGELGIAEDGWCAGSDAERARIVARAEELRRARVPAGGPCQVPAHVAHLIPRDGYCAASPAEQARLVAQAEAAMAGPRSPAAPAGPAPAPVVRTGKGGAAAALLAIPLFLLFRRR